MEHREGNFSGFRQVNIFYRYFLPAGSPRAVLLLVHGLADHSGRYQDFAAYFTKRGYAVCALDLRGHGNSAGIPGFVDKFADFLTDLDLFVSQVRRDFRGLRIFLVGHSIGGTIAVAYAVSHQSELAGLILSAPVLKPGASITRRQTILARWLSALFPRMGVAPIESAAVSRRPEVVNDYCNDPLVFHGKISARLGAELLNVMERNLPGFLPQITLPLLVMYGSEDKLSNPAGCIYLYETAGAADKTIKRYDGLYHEIFNEPERLQVMADTAHWLARWLE